MRSILRASSRFVQHFHLLVSGKTAPSTPEVFKDLTGALPREAAQGGLSIRIAEEPAEGDGVTREVPQRGARDQPCAQGMRCHSSVPACVSRLSSDRAVPPEATRLGLNPYGLEFPDRAVPPEATRLGLNPYGLEFLDRAVPPGSHSLGA